jgi:hypothetical protein
MTPEDKEREDRALDALLVLLLLGEPAGGYPHDLGELEGAGPDLPEAHRQALDALGPDLAARLARRARRPRRRPGGRRPGQADPGPRPTGSLHRGAGGGELTDEARAEMERKVRELEEQENQGRNGQGEEP